MSHIDFISVREVLDSIHAHVELPDDLDALTMKSAAWPMGQGSASMRAYQDVLLRGFFKMTWQHSEAACALDAYLHNAADGEAPRWFDCSQTGRPKFSESSKSEVMTILVHMSGAFQRCYQAYLDGGISVPGKIITMPEGQGMFQKPEDARLLRRVGFDREEISRFLENQGIPSDLCVSQVDVVQVQAENDPVRPQDEQQEPAQDPEQQEREREQEQEQEQEQAIQHGEPVDSGLIEFQKKNLSRKSIDFGGWKGEYWSEIELGNKTPVFILIRTASIEINSTNPTLVWGQMIKICEEKRCESPVEGIGEDNVRWGITYKGRRQKPGDKPKIFTEAALRKFFERYRGRLLEN